MQITGSHVVGRVIPRHAKECHVTACHAISKNHKTSFPSSRIANRVTPDAVVFSGLVFPILPGEGGVRVPHKCPQVM